MFMYYNVVMFSISVMIAGITFSLFDSGLFRSSINGMLVVAFIMYIGTYGGFRIMLINCLPILAVIPVLYFVYHPDLSVMVEFGNVVALIVACLAVSQTEENLRFREFRNGKIADIERERSDSLLLNILPAETANELKNKGTVSTQKFDSVTVLFTDFVGFTSKAETMTPEKLVHSVDYYFRAFDNIVAQFGLEKIKTIGDAYMCAGGIPTPSIDHPLQVTRAAIEMRNFVSRTLNQPPKDIEPFEIRIGIHTGPVVAGVVGIKKFQYDIWGDTVNLAARVESASTAESITISERTYRLLENRFNCTSRGEIPIKNHGVLNMYYVHDEIVLPQNSYPG